MELFWNCEGFAKDHPFGEVSPLILNNGTAIGLKPGEIEYSNTGAGELESEKTGPWRVVAKRKTQGYAAQELIEVKNP